MAIDETSMQATLSITIQIKSDGRWSRIADDLTSHNGLTRIAHRRLRAFLRPKRESIVDHALYLLSSDTPRGNAGMSIRA